MCDRKQIEIIGNGHVLDGTEYVDCIEMRQPRKQSKLKGIREGEYFNLEIQNENES